LSGGRIEVAFKYKRSCNDRVTLLSIALSSNIYENSETTQKPNIAHRLRVRDFRV